MVYHYVPLYKERLKQRLKRDHVQRLGARARIQGVSINGGTPKFWMVFLVGNPSYKWMIWGYPYFRKPPNKVNVLFGSLLCFFVPSLLGNIIGAMDSHCWHTYTIHLQGVKLWLDPGELALAR